VSDAFSSITKFLDVTPTLFRASSSIASESQLTATPLPTRQIAFGLKIPEGIISLD